MMFIEYLLKYVYIFSFLVFMLQNRFLLVYKIVQFRASYLTTCFLESFFYPLHVIKCTCIHYHLYMHLNYSFSKIQVKYMHV